MAGCAKFEAERKFDLKPFLGDEFHLRNVVNFGTAGMPEDLHYEQSYEFLIPHDLPLTVKVCAVPFSENDKGIDGGGELPQFEKIEVGPREILVIWPLFCHRVVEKGRFAVLKVDGKFKVLAKEPGKSGCCPQKECSLWDYCKQLGEENAL